MRIRPSALLPLLLAGCTVGPDYSPPRVAALSDATAFARAGGATAPAAPPAAAWWTALGDPTLDDLEARALARSADVEVAVARVRQARAGLRLERANALPNANASALYLHGELPPTNLGAIGSSNQDEAGGRSEEARRTSLDFYNLGFDASWEVDLFGGKRRAREAAARTAESRDAELADVRVSVAAEVAQAYVNLRDVQARLASAAEGLRLQREQAALLRQRADAGTATRTELAQAVGRIEDAEAQSVPLSSQRDSLMDALAVLAGEAPGALDGLLAPARPVPLPPAAVDVGDPAALVARRPDVRAAERNLAAQTARIGVAEAARFPKLSFMGLIGLGGSDPGDVVDFGNVSAIALPRLSWNVLDFGRNAARVDQAGGARDEALARYRQRVLAALQDAEDALARYGGRRLAFASAGRSEAASRDAAALADQSFAAGTLRRGDMLEARRRRLSAEDALSQAAAAMTNDYVALQKALGLGWSDAPGPAPAASGDAAAGR